MGRFLTLIGKILDKTKATKAVKDKIIELREAQADFLFGELGAGLKAKAAMIEYRNLLKKYPNIDTNRAAKMAANLINDDFGGLHLQRIGRSPTLQHIFRLYALAPDWTESNIRSMVKMVSAGTKEERNMYRKFWAGIATKGVLLTVMANALLSIGADDDEDKFAKKMKRAWGEGRFKWLDVDVTTLYKALGGKTTDRKYFSIIGHFKDPLKFVRHPIRSAQHKSSVVYKMFHETLTGKDWAGRRYTTLKELLAEGKTVTWKPGKGGPVEFEKLTSFILSQLKGLQPVQVQNLISFTLGEMEGFDAIGNSLGLGVRTTYGGGVRTTYGGNVALALRNIREMKKNEPEKYNKLNKRIKYNIKKLNQLRRLEKKVRESKNKTIQANYEKKLNELAKNINSQL